MNTAPERKISDPRSSIVLGTLLVAGTLVIVAGVLWIFPQSSNEQNAAFLLSPEPADRSGAYGAVSKERSDNAVDAAVIASYEKLLAEWDAAADDLYSPLAEICRAHPEIHAFKEYSFET